jgi:D-alanyl-D-alanine dipeptidase
VAASLALAVKTASAAGEPFGSFAGGTLSSGHTVTRGPKVINVRPEDYGDNNASIHQTADRDTLLREFPDDLVERMWIQDWQDLERAYQVGRLVDVPSDPVGRGIVLRLEGASRIGELEEDAYRQTLLCRLTKPAAGLLYRVAARMRLIEGQAYQPLEITSLVRTWEYQLRLADVNPNADKTREGVPPTHVLGVAFDIARSQMPLERQERMEFLLDQMARNGELAYYKEGSSNGLMHYHVIALPSAELALTHEFEHQTVAAQRQSDAMERHHYLPEAPCVTFGSSMEPFSAICSCELPLEASAASAAFEAPTSH